MGQKRKEKQTVNMKRRASGGKDFAAFTKSRCLSRSSLLGLGSEYEKAEEILEMVSELMTKKIRLTLSLWPCKIYAREINIG
ncbi:unnamed protein product [Haemonchus placei]|uniref:Uncharacterized protein n=1 Tax=Haemonchus placei TaxID=6290 RepID=A0A0N4VS31_HAEPC|nr:unnamed protein product [Haemonchus placei]